LALVRATDALPCGVVTTPALVVFLGQGLRRQDERQDGDKGEASDHRKALH